MSSLPLVLFGALSVLFSVFNHLCPEVYMDEVFHVAQAQRYCRGEWSGYDPMITTPPAPYVVPALVSQLVRLVVAWSPGPAVDEHTHLVSAALQCSPKFVRFWNVLYVPFLMSLVSALLHCLHSAPIRAAATRSEELRPFTTAKWKMTLGSLTLDRTYSVSAMAD